MPIYHRDSLASLLDQLSRDPSARAYLLHGERFLCQQTAKKVEEALLARGGTSHHIDGEQENPSATINKIRSFSLLPGRQIYRVSDTRLFHSKNVADSLWKKAIKAQQDNDPEQAGAHLRAMCRAAGLNPGERELSLAELPASQWKKIFNFSKPTQDLRWTEQLLGPGDNDAVSASPSGSDGAAFLEKTLRSGIPAGNALVLLAEEVDKKTQLYKYFTQEQIVIDLSVDRGNTASAKKEQHAVLIELITSTLAAAGKSMTPAVAELLLERVGFHPVAVVMESEKLALYAADRQRIEKDDLDQLVGRTRQEALFELTAALGSRNLEQALLIAGRLLENGIHGLAIIATLRNFARTLLLFRLLQDQPRFGYNRSMPAATFQNNVLPRLKEESRWTKELAGHPYALYMQFKTASNFSATRLQYWLQLLLKTELKLKGSAVESTILLQHLLISMLTAENFPILKN